VGLVIKKSVYCEAFDIVTHQSIVEHSIFDISIYKSVYCEPFDIAGLVSPRGNTVGGRRRKFAVCRVARQLSLHADGVESRFVGAYRIILRVAPHFENSDKIFCPATRLAVP